LGLHLDPANRAKAPQGADAPAAVGGLQCGSALSDFEHWLGIRQAPRSISEPAVLSGFELSVPPSGRGASSPSLSRSRASARHPRVGGGAAETMLLSVGLRSAGLSWSHDTCCIDGEMDRYPMRAYPNPSRAEAEGVAPLFCTSAKLFGAGTLDGAGWPCQGNGVSASGG